MAQIDPSIPLQAKMPQIENPVNALGRAQEVSINALKMGELQRGLQEEEQIRNYLAGADLSKPETRAGLAKFGKSGLAYGKALADQEKAGLETKKLGLDINAKQMDAFRERIGSLEFNPSNANIQAFLEDSVLKGEITPQEAQQRFAQATAVPLNQRPSYFRNMGVKTEERYKMNTISEYQKQSLGVQREGQAITREGQRMQYGPDIVANTVTDAAGNVTQFNRFGEVIGKPGAVGKPSATFEKTKAMQKQMGRDLDLAITEIENAIKKGGTLDKSTASGAGRLLDAAGNFIGYATEGSIASAALKPIADLGLKMVPRFEGPQSDKDTASYKEASGQLANESLPVATRRAAAETVVRLMKARKGQFVTEGMAAEGIGAGAPALPPGFTPDKP
jgi:hypothetical protein